MQLLILGDRLVHLLVNRLIPLFDLLQLVLQVEHLVFKLVLFYSRLGLFLFSRSQNLFILCQLFLELLNPALGQLQFLRPLDELLFLKL